MASTIQIKRGSAATAPATSDLAVGELAYAMDTSNDGAGSKLYIESTNSGGAAIHAIGGKYYTDIVDGAASANTASKLVVRDSSGNFSAGTITAGITGDVTGDVTGNADTATALATGRTIAITGDLAYTSASFTGAANVTGAGTLATVNSNVGNFGSTTAIPVVTVNAKGLVTAVSTAAITTSFTLSDGSNTQSVAGGDTLTVSGTSNEIDVTVSATDTMTVGLVTNPTVAGNLTVSGNLLISGSTTTVDTTNLAVSDPLFSLATGNNSSDAVDIGFYGLYDTSGSQDLYSGLFRDATDGKWNLFKDLQAAPSTTVNKSGAGYAVGVLVAAFEGALTGNVTGTVSSISNHTTANLTENTNLYYTDARVGTFLTSNTAKTINAATIDGGTY